jgi:hypothetical protein
MPVYGASTEVSRDYDLNFYYKPGLDPTIVELRDSIYDELNSMGNGLISGDYYGAPPVQLGILQDHFTALKHEDGTRVYGDVEILTAMGLAQALHLRNSS